LDGELDLVRTLVPWNGLDVAGNPMTGETQLEYLLEIGMGDGIVMAARTGVTTLQIASF
jgi:hypothetical protein